MNTKVIRKEYDKFKIPIEKIPYYDNDPNKFLGRYKRCSILTYGRITYSNSSLEPQKDLNKEN